MDDTDEVVCDALRTLAEVTQLSHAELSAFTAVESERSDALDSSLLEGKRASPVDAMVSFFAVPGPFEELKTVLSAFSLESAKVFSV